MKANDAEVLAAIDGEICMEQAEKLRIIHSHMDNLRLCRLNVKSLILYLAEKYILQANLVSAVPGIQSFAAIRVISEIGVDMSVFPPQRIYALGPVLLRRITRRITRISRAGAYIKPLLVQCALCAIRKKNNPEIRSQYLSIKDAETTRKRLLLLLECCSLPFTTSSKRMSLTIPNFIIGQALHRNIG